MMKKVRLGVVGCGGIVQSAHSKAIAAEMENGRLELTATCDIIIERAENAAKLWGAQHVTENWETMVDHVDAVLIALPHDLHHACGKFFLEHGKHVMMEKPLATTEPDCIDLIETSHRVNKTLMVGYPWRYRESAFFIKELIDSKKYGELFQCSMWTEQYTKVEGGWGSTKKGLAAVSSSATVATISTGCSGCWASRNMVSILVIPRALLSWLVKALPRR